MTNQLYLVKEPEENDKEKLAFKTKLPILQAKSNHLIVKCCRSLNFCVQLLTTDELMILNIL